MTNQILILSLFFFTGFSGLIFYLFSDKVLEKIKHPGLFFALGTLAGTIFFHLLPEYIEHNKAENIAYLLLAVPGFFIWMVPILFKLKKNEEARQSILALIAGDAMHNAFTSILWLSLCIASGRIEFMVIPGILLHEIPHKTGNFGIMIFSGISKKISLLLSIIASLFFFAGLLIYTTQIDINGKIFIPFIIGSLSFTFLSGLYHERVALKKFSSISWLACGIILMILVNLFTHGLH